jgi:GNAT superfamily N-acetyltransferase
LALEETGLGVRKHRAIALAFVFQFCGLKLRNLPLFQSKLIFPMKIQVAQSDADILKCWPVMHVLRPHLQESAFLPTVREMLTEGYRLAFIEENGIAASAIGFRYEQKLFDGKQFYIDDLTTLDEHRGKGYAGLLLDFVFESARALGYDCVTLDSGPTRHDAHRLYLNKGFKIASHHFIWKL